VVEQKLENAKKTGILSLSEHQLEHCPDQVFEYVGTDVLLILFLCVCVCDY
jgi:hypothetical protein